MTLRSVGYVTVGIEVERRDSKWIPLEYRMFWCKQRADFALVDWARDEVGLLTVRGDLFKVQKRMQVGERRRYWVRMRMESHCDYWGEWDTCVEFLKVKRAR
jgi:hypothetical protein